MNTTVSRVSALSVLSGTNTTNYSGKKTSETYQELIRVIFFPISFPNISLYMNQKGKKKRNKATAIKHYGYTLPLLRHSQRNAATLGPEAHKTEREKKKVRQPFKFIINSCVL